MITKLTQAQRAIIPEYREMWLKKALRTAPLERDEVHRIITGLYEKILKKPTPPIIIMSSPLGAWIATTFLYSKFRKNKIKNKIGHEIECKIRHEIRNKIENGIRYEIGNVIGDEIGHEIVHEIGDGIRHEIVNKIENEVGHEIRYKIGYEIRNEIMNEIENKIGHEIRHKIVYEIRNEIRNGIGNGIRNEIGNGIRHEIVNGIRNEIFFVWPYIDGVFSSHFFACWEYFREVCDIKGYPEDWDTYVATSNLQLVYPFNNFCVLSNHPEKISRKNKRLHCENGMALKYRDGWGLWCLHGVTVPQWLVETPVREIDCRRFAEIKNVEVRREFVWKVGVDRIVQQGCGKVISTQGDYQLININLGGSTGTWPYLKMLNPSIGVWHLEHVTKECCTVQQAINFRASRMPSLQGRDWKPEVIT